jgi:hypothetical protein
MPRQARRARLLAAKVRDARFGRAASTGKGSRLVKSSDAYGLPRRLAPTVGYNGHQRVATTSFSHILLPQHLPRGRQLNTTKWLLDP